MARIISALASRGARDIRPPDAYFRVVVDLYCSHRRLIEQEEKERERKRERERLVSSPSPPAQRTAVPCPGLGSLPDAVPSTSRHAMHCTTRVDTVRNSPSVSPGLPMTIRHSVLCTFAVVTNCDIIHGSLPMASMTNAILRQLTEFVL